MQARLSDAEEIHPEAQGHLQRKRKEIRPATFGAQKCIGFGTTEETKCMVLWVFASNGFDFSLQHTYGSKLQDTDHLRHS